jgi:hypothetical protein
MVKNRTGCPITFEIQKKKVSKPEGLFLARELNISHVDQIAPLIVLFTMSLSIRDSWIFKVITLLSQV